MSTTTAMRVAFITHGGATIGLGHVRRCLALARILAAGGAEVSFLISPDTQIARLVQSAGFVVSEVAWDADAALAARALRTCAANVAVVDAYSATPQFFGAIRAEVKQLIAVDDAGDRPMPVDVVVNGGVGAEGLVYRAARHTLLLLGVRYALIEPTFAEVPRRMPGESVDRILVTLGGSVHLVAARAAVAAARMAARDAVVDVILGPYTGEMGAPDSIAAAGKVILHGHVHEARPLMLQADLAITGAGMTLYELAATATPCVMVMTAPNQLRNVEGFQQTGAAVFGGSAADPQLQETLEGQIHRLVTSAKLRVALGEAARRLVDGEGALRVARELRRAVGTAG